MNTYQLKMYKQVLYLLIEYVTIKCIIKRVLEIKKNIFTFIL